MFNNKNIEKRLEFIEFEIRNKMAEIRATNDNLFDLYGRIYKEIKKENKILRKKIKELQNVCKN